MSRPIDADCINFYKATVARGMHSFENVEIVEKFQIDRMPTIGPESLRPRWIPVTERMPETYENVLAYCKYPMKMFLRIANTRTQRAAMCAVRSTLRQERMRKIQTLFGIMRHSGTTTRKGTVMKFLLVGMNASTTGMIMEALKSIAQ